MTLRDDTVAERYLRLGLRLGRHVDGIVDSYYGPADLAAEVEAAPPVEPAVLVADADALVDALDDCWLRDQALGLRTYAGVLAGEAISYPDEVERCYGVRPTHTDESVFAAAHERLEELLPGRGTLGERYLAWRESIRIPAELVERTVEALLDEARSQTRELIDLPDGEGVTLEIVRDVAWMAFCEYQGNLRSHISVNVDLPLSAFDLLILTLHETYPGHHTEGVSKEQLLVRGRGLIEQTIMMVPTPQSLLAEGIAMVGPRLLLEGDGGERLAAIVRDAGVDFDLEHALDVARAHEPCESVSVNASLLLHDEGAAESDVSAYLRQWGLVSEEVAGHSLRFFKEPTSRSYVVNYAAGLALCGAYVAGRPERFRRLLTQQVRVGELLAAGDQRVAPAP